jgi:predicted transcriptional regulator
VAVRSFGELEAAIMDYLWSQDGPRTVREMCTPR